MVINRIKPHTKFSADIASGLCKMLTIGLADVTTKRLVDALDLLHISKTLAPEVLSNPKVEQITPWKPLRFDENENLTDLP